MSVKASTRILVGCVGIAILALGLGLATIEISHAASLGEWRATTLLDIARSEYGHRVLPDAFAFWLAQPRTFKTFRDVVVYALDFTPVWLGAVLLGGVILWKAVRTA